jgi:hypothetical protein
MTERVIALVKRAQHYGREEYATLSRQEMMQGWVDLLKVLADALEEIGFGEDSNREPVSYIGGPLQITQLVHLRGMHCATEEMCYCSVVEGLYLSLRDYGLAT